MTADIDLDNVRLKLGNAEFHFHRHIDAGSFVAVTGPSGSGKTTLFNLIAGFVAPDTGAVRIGQAIMNDTPPAARPVSLIFQDHNLFAHLNVFKNVALGIHPALRLKGEDRARIDVALEEVGLAGFGERMPGSLSGGERQRVAFARALVRKRPVLLLDEPFASLDPHLRVEMGALLTKLHRREGATILIITHEPAEAERLANYTIRIENGRIAG
ncbi:ATP-binding cassette domain-containing protein [Rhizobium sp. L1K21]|uniref:thiamine ABC transporter ATP-binding protein n=1 Tax=Rhizobium sp. L1K21 TaxID=2954933 RepID=UPI002092B321|nr:ATP-binding cassette domain-containing protein [Rhizobium sp. L1K21]MCO6188062.1 ATP-binding cassette domain-containing protein [Rhizobium sp. L1K21]